MEDQAKLRRIAKFINDHLKHPDRSPSNGPSPWAGWGSTALWADRGAGAGRAEQAAAGKERVQQDHSWLVEASTKDGHRWRNGVRLATKEEAEVYIEAHAAFDLEKAGYVTAGRSAAMISELQRDPETQGGRPDSRIS